MRMTLSLAALIALLCAGAPSVATAAPGYAWRSPADAATSGTLEQRFAPPAGFARVAAAADSWAA